PSLLRTEILPFAGPPIGSPERTPDISPTTTPLGPVPATTPHGPLIVIGPRTAGGTGPSTGRRTKRVAQTAGLAAAAAVAAGLFIAWPSPGDGSPSGLTAVAPNAHDTGYSASLAATPDYPGASPANTVAAPFAHVPGISPAPQPSWPDGAGDQARTTPAAREVRPDRPNITHPPDMPPPSTSQPPTTPTTPPTQPPTDPPADPPTETPSETPQPTPTPSSDPSTPVSEEAAPSSGP
ncbi:hypothetical protein HKK72_29875, partial [Actinomadura sp. HBU206391]|nr:hypothetical protein [Actinomadura sp. HBU206391]